MSLLSNFVIPLLRIVIANRRRRFDEPHLRSPRPSRRRRRPDAGGVTVEPNRPSGLSGGAAAELEYDD